MNMSAQSDSSIIKKDITIEKEYTPTIKDAGKINELPSISEPKLNPSPVKYSDFTTTLEPEYEVRQLEAARLKSKDRNASKNGFLRLGIANYLGTLGDLVLPIVQTEKYSLDFNLNHKGIFDGHDGATHHKTDASVGFDRYFQEGDLFVDAGYSFRGFNYYGDNKLDKNESYTINNTDVLGKNFFYDNAYIHTWNAAVGYKSYPDDDLVNSLSASIAYDGFMPNEGLAQHHIDTRINYKRSVTDDSWGIDLNLQNFIYDGSKLDDFYSKPNAMVYFKLNPYYQFMRKRWNLKIGAILNTSNVGSNSVAPTADINGTLTLVKNTLFFYAAIEGDYRTNSLPDMLNLCHYINLNEQIKPTYSPFDIKAGFKLKILYNLLTDLSVEYKMYKDMCFLVNDTATSAAATVQTNVFTPHYKDANVFTASFRSTYNFNEIMDFLLSFKYHKWFTDEAYNIPQRSYTTNSP